MSDRTRGRSGAAVKDKVELPEMVTLYPDAHFTAAEEDSTGTIPPRDVMTVPRERAMELLAIGRRHTNKDGSTTPAWDGDEICPAYHLEIQLARFPDQKGLDAPQWADWPDDEPPANAPAMPKPVKPSKALIAATERTPEVDSGPPDNPADQAADQNDESPA